MKHWTINSPDENIISRLMAGCGISSLAAAVLANRGYSSPDSIMQKLNVTELSDPFLIKDMKEAADVINETVENGGRICVYGDYDCDGIMATLILYLYLRELGADVFYYIPERKEGYGLNYDAVSSIALKDTDLIVTVDNGIAALDEAEFVYSKGMRLVVTDHHRQGEKLPRAEAVVDTHRHDCFSPYKDMCGAGIALKLVAALEGGDYTMALEQFGDLAAIATVADVVPLTGENRFLVSYGLRLINHSDRPALMALIKVSGLDGKTINSQSIGFALAPRINAAGRYASPNDAMKLFLCEEHAEASFLADRLDKINDKRKSIEGHILNSIYEVLDQDPSFVGGRVICLNGGNWHRGVIGIVAARLLERFGKPVFLSASNGEDVRGSARAFGDFSVHEALSYASDALERFGGHPAAGGFTIKMGRSAEFDRLLQEYALKYHREMPVLTVTADASLDPSDITVQSVKGLDVLEPFGQDNEKPVFHIGGAKITEIIPLSGGLHTKIKFSLEGEIFEGLIFGTSPNALCFGIGSVCDMLVSLGINEFRGKTSVSIVISDIRPQGFEQKKYFAAKNSFEALLREEKLPPKYYANMLPSRDDAVKIYKLIPSNGINSDQLYLRLGDPKINFCKFSVALEAFRQLELVTVSSSDNTVKRRTVRRKANLDSSPVFRALKDKIRQNNLGSACR